MADFETLKHGSLLLLLLLLFFLVLHNLDPYNHEEDGYPQFLYSSQLRLIFQHQMQEALARGGLNFRYQPYNPYMTLHPKTFKP